jgi:hypothetical protein
VEPSFIINLWAGSSPPALARLPHLEFQHLEVFTSRTREEGRERFRLHVGYFDNPQVAERILKRVRDVYPTAWVVPADRHLPVARLKGVVSARLSSGDGSNVTRCATLSGDKVMDVAHPLQTLPSTAMGEHGSLPRPCVAVEAGGVQGLAPPEQVLGLVAGPDASGMAAAPLSAVDTVTPYDLAVLDASEVLGLLEGPAGSCQGYIPEFSAMEQVADFLRADVENVAIIQVGEHEGLSATPTLPLPVPSELARALPGVLRSASQVERPGGSFPKFSIEEWRAEAPPKAEPKPRSWFQRLTG